MDYMILETHSKEMDPAKQIIGVKGWAAVDGKSMPVTLNFTHLGITRLIEELQHWLKERADEGFDS